MLKSISKPKATRLIFTTQKIIFNEEKIPNILNISNVIKTAAAIAKKPKISSKKIKKLKNQNNN